MNETTNITRVIITDSKLGKVYLNESCTNVQVFTDIETNTLTISLDSNKYFEVENL